MGRGETSGARLLGKKERARGRTGHGYIPGASSPLVPSPQAPVTGQWTSGSAAAFEAQTSGTRDASRAHQTPPPPSRLPADGDEPAHGEGGGPGADESQRAKGAEGGTGDGNAGCAHARNGSGNWNRIRS